MLEVAQIATASYMVAGIVKETKIFPKEVTPLIALVVGILLGVGIAYSNGQSIVSGILNGIYGLLATGGHEAGKVIGNKIGGEAIENEDLSNMGDHEIQS